MQAEETETVESVLTGKTVVVTGTLPTLGRKEASELIEKYGGKASGSVSKKTDYVLAGENAGNQSVQMENLQGTLDLIDAMNEMNIKTFVGAGSLHEAESIIEMSEDKVISNLGYMYKATKMAAHWMGKARREIMELGFFGL